MQKRRQKIQKSFEIIRELLYNNPRAGFRMNLQYDF